MANKEFETDEDKMMYALKVHRDLIGWVINKLKAEGVSCERTRGNDPGGDIIYFNADDEPKVKEVIRQLNLKYNPSKPKDS